VAYLSKLLSIQMMHIIINHNQASDPSGVFRFRSKGQREGARYHSSQQVLHDTIREATWLACCLRTNMPSHRKWLCTSLKRQEAAAINAHSTSEDNELHLMHRMPWWLRISVLVKSHAVVRSTFELGRTIIGNC
jgi:hypothetical protein